MSISDGQYVLAEIKVSGLNGVPGLGINRLQFSLEISINPTRGNPASVGSLLCFVWATASPSGTMLPLGVAVPETTWFSTTQDFARRDHLLLNLDLSGEQLSALEKLRAERSVYFRLDVHAIVHGNNGDQRVFEQIHYEANLSIWSKVLKDFGAYEFLLLSVQFPLTDVSQELQSAVAQLRAAHADLIAGRYDSVVARTRLCLDAIDRRMNGEAVGNQALTTIGTKDSREKMSKPERANAVRASIRHYTHLAHHVDGAGVTETFSRHDAVFILCGAAAAVWDAAGRALALQELSKQSPLPDKQP